MRKSVRTLAIAGVLSLTCSFVSMAAWEQRADGTWTYSDNGSYLTGWQWIDGDNNGTAECYYLDAMGLMASSTTIEGYTVNESGAWVIDGVVQTKTLISEQSSSSEVGGGNNLGSKTYEGGWTLPIATTNGEIEHDLVGGDSTGLPPMQAGTGGGVTTPSGSGGSNSTENNNGTTEIISDNGTKIRNLDDECEGGGYTPSDFDYYVP